MIEPPSALFIYHIGTLELTKLSLKKDDDEVGFALHCCYGDCFADWSLDHFSPDPSFATVLASIVLHNTQVFDATWFLAPAHGPRNADAEFIERRIPGAMRFDLDTLADPKEKDLPHMLPPVDWFGSKMDEMGVSPNDQIVVYDVLGQFSAARAFWTLHVLGAKDVKMLDGGLPLWIAEKRKIESGPVKIKPHPNPPGTWAKNATPRLQQVVKVDTIQRFAEQSLQGKKLPNVQLVDARPKNRFLGIDPEPRPNLKKGRIPGSVGVPFKDVLNTDGTFKDKEALKKLFSDAGIDVSGKSTVITSCGSGTTAAVLTFALQELLGINAPLYDGSFAEWGKITDDRPVE